MPTGVISNETVYIIDIFTIALEIAGADAPLVMGAQGEPIFRHARVAVFVHIVRDPKEEADVLLYSIGVMQPMMRLRAVFEKSLKTDPAPPNPPRKGQ